MKTVQILFFVLMLLLGNSAAGQEKAPPPPPPRQLHFEIGGTGGIAGLAYESQFKKRRLNYSAGFSFIRINTNNVFIFPLMLKKNFGSGSHRLETGIGNGFVLAFGDGAKFFSRAILLCGWRFQRDESPFVFRVFYSPFVSYLIDVQYQHWGGIGIGYQFGKR